ncbi:MAG: hypothetical protein CSA33_03475 [Desulfobulbus propionicus]|nr:MAG: hypothetical protein CSA33_03475 [Desulfobulbus propionicus]
MNRFIPFLAVAVYGLLCFTGSVQAEITIGVLAKNGPGKTLKKWSAHGEYLTEKMGEDVRIIPLDFDKVAPAVAAGEVDFFLANSSMYITMHIKHGASAVATMINSRLDKALDSFGGVVLTSAYNDNINSFEDLKGKSFAAVKKNSFGGWQMAYKEFIDSNIDPFKDFSSVTFVGKHDHVVLAVQNEEFEGGTVRTDTLERMAANGTIAMEDFKVIGPKAGDDFPFLRSTKLYPEWPLAKIQATDPRLAEKIGAALRALTADDKAAKTAQIKGWAPPMNYTGVEELQKALSVGAYTKEQ